jgi:hypothetical protein
VEQHARLGRPPFAYAFRDGTPILLPEAVESLFVENKSGFIVDGWQFIAVELRFVSDELRFNAIESRFIASES